MGGDSASEYVLGHLYGGEALSGLLGGPRYGLQGKVDDLAIVHLLAFSDAHSEFGLGEVLVQHCR